MPGLGDDDDLPQPAGGCINAEPTGQGTGGNKANSKLQHLDRQLGEYKRELAGLVELIERKGANAARLSQKGTVCGKLKRLHAARRKELELRLDV